MEDYVPIIAWGYIGIIFSAMLTTFGIWAMAHGIKYKVTDNIILSVILIAFAFISIIASMWHFGLI